MKPSEPLPPSASYSGRVRDGVVILDSPGALQDGQAVRVEPVTPDAERAERIQRLRELFAQWTEEDAKLSDEQADLLRNALREQRGLSLRQPSVD